MTSARDTAVHKFESKTLQRILGRPTRDHANKICLNIVVAVPREIYVFHFNFLVSRCQGEALLLKMVQHLGDSFFGKPK